MDTLKLSKQEISLSLMIWDTVYTKIDKCCPRCQNKTQSLCTLFSKPAFLAFVGDNYMCSFLLGAKIT